LALSVFLSPMGSAATAPWRGYEPVTRTVSFADLDLTNSKGVAALYRRIKSAADLVCENAGERGTLLMSMYVRKCTRQAIDQAVREVNSSGLKSLHASATNQIDFQ